MREGESRGAEEKKENSEGGRRKREGDGWRRKGPWGSPGPIQSAAAAGPDPLHRLVWCHERRSSCVFSLLVTHCILCSWPMITDGLLVLHCVFSVPGLLHMYLPGSPRCGHDMYRTQQVKLLLMGGHCACLPSLLGCPWPSTMNSRCLVIPISSLLEEVVDKT